MPSNQAQKAVIQELRRTIGLSSMFNVQREVDHLHVADQHTINHMILPFYDSTLV